MTDTLRRSGHGAGIFPGLASMLGMMMLSALPAAADQILLRTGSPLNQVTVESEDFREVTYKRAGVPDAQKIQSRSVAQIVREPSSEAYNQGLEYLEKGDAENAAKSFQLAISKDGASKAWVREYAQYQLGRALFLAGAANKARYAEALAALRKLKSDFPSSRFLPDTEILIARGLIESEAYRDAELHLQDLENQARSKFGIYYELLAKEWSARNLSRQGKYAEARNFYNSLYQAAQRALGSGGSNLKEFEKKDISDLAAKAHNLEGECLVLAKSYGEAKAFYEGVIREASQAGDTRALAGAYYGKGQALFYMRQPLEAFESFAHTTSLYYQNDDETARALFWAGAALQTFQKEGGASLGAQSYFQQVQAVYPASEWAAKIQKGDFPRYE